MTKTPLFLAIAAASLPLGACAMTDTVPASASASASGRNPIVGGAAMYATRNIVEMPSSPPITRPWSPP
jgi:hypothetical protein